MIEDIVYFSPLLCLICGIALLFAGYLKNAGLNSVFRITKLSLIFSFGLAVIFYNRTAFSTAATADMFSAFFQGIMYTSALAVLFLSRKWYAAADTDGYLFCGALLLAVISGSLLSESENLALTTGSLCLLMLSGYLLFLHADKIKENYAAGILYLIPAVFLALSAVCGTFLLYRLCGNLNYDILAVYFDVQKENPYIFSLAAIFVLQFIFLFGIAPLHFWYTETAGRIILPVFTCFTLVPLGGIFAGFIRLNLAMLPAQLEQFSFFYKYLALLSVFTGAVGSCSGKNVWKIFACGAVYHLGVVLLILRQFTPSDFHAAAVSLTVYILAMYGVCASLYGLKSKGEYLFMLSDFSGAAYKRPYISVMLIIFLFSLLGMPPFLGCLGQFGALNNLLLNGSYCSLAVLLVFLTVLACGYLQIVRALYAENGSTLFDRADRGIYIAVCLDFLLMAWIMLKPDFWEGCLEKITSGGSLWSM